MRRLKMPLMAGLFCALAAACAHENTTNGNGTKGNTDTDETVTIFSSTTKEIASGSATRTSISHIHGSGATAFWELGDKIWVEKGGTLRESVSSDITAKTATAKFTLSGTYTAANYMVFYTGANSTAGDRVTIPATQTQTSANSTTHFGTSGDCGVANASGDGEDYDFALDHKAAYLCFLPRTTATSLVKGFVIQSITVTCDGDIAGEYAFTAAGIGSATGTTSKEITLNVNNFPLTNTSTNQALNAAYMVIRPQTTAVALNIRYKLHNPVTNVTGTLTKHIPAQKYNANQVYDIRANLVPKDYSEEVKGYQWDAKKDMSQDPSGLSADVKFNTIFTPNAVSHATQSCAECPTGVQLLWYCVTNPYKDDEELWTANGVICKGVMRFKKWNAMVAEDGASLTTLPSITDPNKSAVGSVEEPGGRNAMMEAGLPAPAVMNNYFAVPLRKDTSEYDISYWASTTNPTATYSELDLPVSYMTIRANGRLMWVGNRNYISKNRNSVMRAMKFE